MFQKKENFIIIIFRELSILIFHYGLYLERMLQVKVNDPKDPMLRYMSDFVHEVNN